MEIRPFKGWRYATGSDGELGSVLAPPYDVLSGTDKQRLLAGDGHNIVAIDLPQVPPSQAGPDALYAQAADLLSQWRDEGVLVQEDAPALYVYDQTFGWAGREYTRRSLLTGVRATELGADVIPHEHTFAGPKEDRLKLTRATGMQLSPIFGFYDDPGQAVAKALQVACDRAPDAVGQLGDVGQKLWVLREAATVQIVRDALAEVPAYIADGHHRYTTAMNYAAGLRESGQIGPDHEASFVLFALVAREDPGLLVLPTHRVFRGLNEQFSVGKMIQAMKLLFEVNPVSNPPADLTDADAYLAGVGPGTMGIIAQDQLFTCRLTHPERMVEIAPEHCQPWRELDVAILHELVTERILKPWRTDAYAVDFTPDGQAARQAVDQGHADVAFLLQHTPVRAVRAVADAGDSMPHKSTYFYPKLATGLVIKPLS